MNQERISYRRAFDSPYLSSADLEKLTVLTIDRVVFEKNKIRKKQQHNVAYFVEKELRQGEPLKPMILNVTNCKVLQKITGSIFIQDWTGVQVGVFVAEGVKQADGTVGEGLRLTADLPRRENLTPQHKAWDNAIDRYRNDGDFSAIEKHMDIHEAVKAQIVALVAAERQHADVS